MKNFSVAALIVLGIIWGTNFIYMKLASGFISPVQIVFFRILFGFIIVFLISLWRKEMKLQHLKFCIHFIIMAVLATVIQYYGYASGTAMLPSGIAGALSGTISPFSFLFAILFIKNEKATNLKITGVIMGFAGVMIISKPFGQDLSNTNYEGIIHMLAGSMSLGASFVYAKKFISPLSISSLTLTTYQLGASLTIMALFTDFNNINNVFSNPQVAMGLIVGLGILGTGLAYVIYYHIINKLGAVTASSVAYIPPVVALFIGTVFANEKIELSDYLATLFIILGMFLLSTKRKLFSAAKLSSKVTV